jgi:hypothetical protein
MLPGAPCKGFTVTGREPFKFAALAEIIAEPGPSDSIRPSALTLATVASEEFQVMDPSTVPVRFPDASTATALNWMKSPD